MKIKLKHFADEVTTKINESGYELLEKTILPNTGMDEKEQSKILKDVSVYLDIQGYDMKLTISWEWGRRDLVLIFNGYDTNTDELIQEFTKLYQSSKPLD